MKHRPCIRKYYLRWLVSPCLFGFVGVWRHLAFYEVICAADQISIHASFWFLVTQNRLEKLLESSFLFLDRYTVRVWTYCKSKISFFPTYLEKEVLYHEPPAKGYTHSLIRNHVNFEPSKFLKTWPIWGLKISYEFLNFGAYLVIFIPNIKKICTFLFSIGKVS